MVLWVIHVTIYVSKNHIMVQVGKDLKDDLVPTPLPWARTPPTAPGCSKHDTIQYGVMYGVMVLSFGKEPHKCSKAK